MGRNQKIITTVLWGVLVLTMIAVVGTGLFARRDDRSRAVVQPPPAVSGQLIGPGGEEQPRLSPLYEVPAFSLTDQTGKTVTEADLRGRPWVGAFIFTHCAQDCPMMGQKFKALQDQMKGTDMQLVSFTLDPERDTPTVLADYAKRLGADATRWHFLTGPKQTMFDTAAAMKVAAAPATDTTPLTHGDWFVLVDGRGWIRGYYRSKDADSLKQLPEDAATLSREAHAGKSAAAAPGRAGGAS
jgi:cytochrome oxidase Cu insertion factor (SCO1/SenC/PrrC family)